MTDVGDLVEPTLETRVALDLSKDAKLQVVEPKPIIKSQVMWGLVGIAIPFLDNLYAYAVSLPNGMLPKWAQLSVTGLGVILAAYGRLSKANSPIVGVLR